MIRFEDVAAARHRISPHIRTTPMIAMDENNTFPAAGNVWMKLELLQMTGSFKVRGATNKLLTTPAAEMESGIVTASGGNHGLAVAHVARTRGVPATIFVPQNVSPSKVTKLKSYGADVRITGAAWHESNVAALAFAREKGAAYFHPFADPAVMAGQGTLAMEILEENPDLDTVLIGIGGGGLISGMSVALKHLKPGIRIIGVEPEGCPTFHASFAAGKAVRLPDVTTRVATMACAIADEKVFETSRHAIEQVVLLSDEQMLEGARWLWDSHAIGADLSGAAAVAALQSGAFKPRPGEKVCALVCGAGPDGIAE